MQTLNKLKQIQRVWSKSKMKKVVVLQDNASPHTSLPAREVTATVGWSDLPHPPCSPDLASFNFYLSGLVKDALQARHFTEMS